MSPSRPASKARRQGSLKEIAPGKWAIRLSLSGSIRFNRTITGSKADAQKILNEQVRQRDAGVRTAPTRQRLGEWVDTWLAHHCSSQSVRTRYDSRAILDRYLTPQLKARRLTELSPTDVQRWVNALSTDRKLSPRTVQLARATLRNCLARAVKLELIPRNVARDVDVPKLRKANRVVLSASDAQRFLDACKHHPWGACFTLMLHTGLRPAEALGLRWRDLQGSDLHVEHALVRVKGHAAHLSTTKTGVTRTIPLGPELLAVLQRHRVAQVERRLLLGELYTDLDLIFPNEFGGFANTGNLLTRQFAPLLKSIGLPHMRLYDLRHSSASLLLAAGEQVKVVQERLGHASATLTLDTYSHVLPGAQQQTSLRMEALLAQSAGR